MAHGRRRVRRARASSAAGWQELGCLRRRRPLLALEALDERGHLAARLGVGRRRHGLRRLRGREARQVHGLARRRRRRDGGGAAARWGDASGVVAGARTVSGSGTAGNLLLEPTRLGGVAGEIGEGGGGGASTTSPGGAAAGGAFINAARRASSALAFTGTTPVNSAATVTTAAAGLSPGASASAALARTTLSESHARARHA